MTSNVAPNAGPGTNTGYERADRAVTGACVTYLSTDGAIAADLWALSVAAGRAGKIAA